MWSVRVGSGNPVKVEAVRRALAAAGVAAEVEGVAVTVDVPAQPVGNAQTLRGATLRAEALPARDLRVGIEGGVFEPHDRRGTLDAMAWVVALRGDLKGVARTATFALPPALARMVHEGLELGDADDRLFGHSGNKRRGGTVGTLTGGVLDRTAYYEHAVTLALIPVLRPDLYAT